MRPSSSYSVERLLGCTIVRGTVPLADIALLMQRAARSEVIAPGIGRRIGATMVFGRPEDLQKLRDAGLPACEAVQREIAAARGAGLCRDALDWLDGYDRGLSSDCLFSLTTGVQLGERAVHIPQDSDDFGRCYDLVKLVVDVRTNLQRARCEPVWAAVLDRWAELVAEYEGGAHRAVSDRLAETSRQARASQA